MKCNSMLVKDARCMLRKLNFATFRRVDHERFGDLTAFARS